MTTNVATRAQVDAFFAAYASHDAEAIARQLHDDVEWSISGPVDLLAYCGRRVGKAAVVDLVARVFPGIFSKPVIECGAVLLDGDRAATLTRIASRSRQDGRIISYRIANFLRFRDGLLIERIAIIDSFDAAEQMLGHPIAVHDGQKGDRANPDFNDLAVVQDAGGLVAL
ncbi:MAG: hypothetical protein GC182_11025 [Rhodopseudomonas sp.]|nr:hypothetical protein [Rhodopseudomonas sp.]